MPKKVTVQKNSDNSSDESETLTKPKVKKTEELTKPKQKKKMTENQLNNLKKSHEILQKNNAKIKTPSLCIFLNE